MAQKPATFTIQEKIIVRFSTFIFSFKIVKLQCMDTFWRGNSNSVAIYFLQFI